MPPLLCGRTYVAPQSGRTLRILAWCLLTLVAHSAILTANSDSATSSNHRSSSIIDIVKSIPGLRALKPPHTHTLPSPAP
eukprot:588323-Prymnesium_polylepis.1